ncbi:hypothetical protein DIS15_03460 [Levilactobacillus brevis]|uniref:hypothetical protein n=1 Tax=Levilactobacillus brevis TaxID=1580 RepID=UPI0011240B5D|nr:hypothetical protein [Levilactobacillus brevis]TOY85853.1 hypothetical protein DIS15_03460 [Levilactobacillus brevis]
MTAKTDRTLLLLRSELDTLDSRTNNERIRYQLYSIYVNILINHTLFPKNDDIKTLCSSLNFELKDYVFRSRTLLIARFMRKIEHLNDDDIIAFLKVAKSITAPKDKKAKTFNEGPDSNYLDRFGRS